MVLSQDCKTKIFKTEGALARNTYNKCSSFRILNNRLISVPCPAGTYQSADKTECLPCEEGTVSSETGATTCTTCDLGKQANSDKTLCGKWCWYLFDCT